MRASPVVVALFLLTLDASSASDAQERTRRLLHADLLLRQSSDELDALDLGKVYPNVEAAVMRAQHAVGDTLEQHALLRPYKAVVRERRAMLLSRWWRAAASGSNGRSQLLLETSALAFRPATGKRKHSMLWTAVLVRLCCTLKRVASLLDDAQFSAVMETVLTAAVHVQELLPPTDQRAGALRLN